MKRVVTAEVNGQVVFSARASEQNLQAVAGQAAYMADEEFRTGATRELTGVTEVIIRIKPVKD